MRLLLLMILAFLYSCKEEKKIYIYPENRVIVKMIDNNNFKATLFKESKTLEIEKSAISDIDIYVAIEKNNKENIVFHGNFGSVIDIYFKGKDTLYLKRYQPSTKITYEYKKEIDGLKIVQDTLVTEEEYYQKTTN